MSVVCRNVTEAMERIDQRDPTLAKVDFSDECIPDAELSLFVDCLLANPDVITHAIFALGQMSDETGVKLARYVAASSTIQKLDLEDNNLGLNTYLALAAALRVNISLRALFLFDNRPIDRHYVDEVFAESLRINSNRPVDSMWCLHETFNDFPRLLSKAGDMGHPTLQMTLSHELEKKNVQAIKRIS